MLNIFECHNGGDMQPTFRTSPRVHGKVCSFNLHRTPFTTTPGLHVAPLLRILGILSSLPGYSFFLFSLEFFGLQLFDFLQLLCAHCLILIFVDALSPAGEISS
jgi:hypothetical protein